MNPSGSLVASLVPLPVLLPLLGAGVTLVLSRRPRAQRAVSLAVLVVVVALAALLLVASVGGIGPPGPLVVTLASWPVPVGITLVADGLSTVMLLTSMTVTLLVLVYAIGQGTSDDEERAPVSIFHPTYLVLCAGVANAFLSGDLFNLYVGFEILLMASYVLLTLGGTRSRVRAGLTYVVVNVVSSLVFLLGIALVYAATGTLNLAQLAVRLEQIPPGTALALHLVLLTAFGIKAAVFPLSAWLPDSYPTAAAPVTAVFAGLLTKVGVYSIIRTQTLLFPDDGIVRDVLLVAALATMVVGALGAIAQSDLKRVLSFTLVSHIGYMVFGVGLATPAGVAGAVFYVVHHITVQATLFCVAGLVERVGGSTSTTRLAGLGAAAPLLAVLYFLPAVNLGGVPPLSGFVGKLGLLEAGVQDGSALAWVLVVGAVLTSLLTLYAMIKVWVLAFWRPPEQVPTPGPGGPDGPGEGDADDGQGGEGEDEDEDAGVGVRAPREPVPAGANRAAGGDGRIRSGAALRGRPDGAGRAVDLARSSRPPEPSFSGGFLGLAHAGPARPGPHGGGTGARMPRTMTLATAALVALGLSLTVVAGPLYTVADRAAADLVARTPYIDAVLGGQNVVDRVSP